MKNRFMRNLNRMSKKGMKMQLIDLKGGLDDILGGVFRTFRSARFPNTNDKAPKRMVLPVSHNGG